MIVSGDNWLPDAKAAIRSRTDLQPRIGIILGSGLGQFAAAVKPAATISYREIPGLPVSTAIGHKGQLTLGHFAGHAVAVMEGRFHLYEGYSADQVARPIELLRSLGVDVLVITNAAGGLNPQLRMGDIVVIQDHINLMWDTPAKMVDSPANRCRPEPPSLGHPGLPDRRGNTTGFYYDREMAEQALETALTSGIRASSGVYVGMTGPNYETRAEYRWLRTLGDVVGMSTVPETLAARTLGIRVLGLSVVSNECNPDALEPTDGAQVVAAVSRAETRLRSIVTSVLGRVSQRTSPA